MLHQIKINELSKKVKAISAVSITSNIDKKFDR